MTIPVPSPTDRGEFQTLNGLRGIAAIAVMIYHFREVLGPVQIAPSAYLAVDLFFLMSGLVIAHAYDAKLRSGQISFLNFFRARTIRLYPVYLATLLIGIAYFAVRELTEPGGDSPLSVEAIGMGVFGLPMFWSADRQLFPFNPASWSLFFEMVANLLYALMITRLSNRVLAVLVVIAAIALVWSGLTLGSLDHGSGGAYAWMGLIRVAFSFTLGVLMWRLRSFARGSSNPLAFWILFLVIALLAAPIPIAYRATFDLLCVMVVFPVVMIAAIRVEPSGRAAGLFRISGEISYPVYLLHGPVFLFAAAAYKMVISPDLATSQPYLGIGAILAILCGAYVMFHFYDVPARRLLNRALVLGRPPERDGRDRALQMAGTGDTQQGHDLPESTSPQIIK